MDNVKQRNPQLRRLSVDTTHNNMRKRPEESEVKETTNNAEGQPRGDFIKEEELGKKRQRSPER